MDSLKFTCPKCAHDRVYAIVGTGMMRCSKCRFAAVPTSFKLEPRPGLRWDEATENHPEQE